MATTMVHVRVDEKVKAEAAKTLAKMGMSLSDAIRVLLVRGRRREGPALRCESSQRNHGESDAGGGPWPGQALQECRRAL